MPQQITTLDDFIDKVATRSSISGNEYKVRLNDGTERPLADWLGEQARENCE